MDSTKISFQNPSFEQIMEKIHKLSSDEQKLLHLSRNGIFRSSATISPFNFIQRNFDVMHQGSMLVSFLEERLCGAKLLYDDPTRCGNTDSAIKEFNPLNQPFVHDFTSIDEAISDLEGEEEGLYSFEVYSCPLLKESTSHSEERLFCGHAFSILKARDSTGKMNYQILQSFIGEYTLKEFLDNNGSQFHFKNFKALNKSVTQPFRRIIEVGDRSWSASECFDLKKITTVYLNLIGFRPKQGALEWKVSKTTSTPPLKPQRSYLPSLETIGLAEIGLGAGLIYLVSRR